MFLRSVEAAQVFCEMCWCKGSFPIVWVCVDEQAEPHINPPSLECSVQPLPAHAGPSVLGMMVCTRSWWCRDRLWAEPGLTAGWWQPQCQEKAGFASEWAAVCDHQVTEVKQKGPGTTGQLEMSVKSKERDERRRRSVDCFLYHSR